MQESCQSMPNAEPGVAALGVSPLGESDEKRHFHDGGPSHRCPGAQTPGH